MRLAELEISEQHFDQAESILREAYRRKPSWFIAYQLAYVLILQDKIDGEGQAQDYLAILAKRGTRRQLRARSRGSDQDAARELGRRN